MEKDNTQDENESRENIAEKLEYRIDQLEGSLKTVSSELETIKVNVQKRKTENTTLKILFYTGLIVLFLGFLYTNSTLQRAQMDSLESSIHTLQTLMNREMITVEKNVYGRIDRLEQSAEQGTKIGLQERLENMTLAISQLHPGDSRTARLIEQVKRETMELSQAVADASESEGDTEGADENDPGDLEKRVFGQN